MNVLAVAQIDFYAVQLIARAPGIGGNSISIAATTGTTITTTITTTNGVAVTTDATSGTSTLKATTSAAMLSGGGTAATLAPGAILSVEGSNLSDNTITTPADTPSFVANDAPAPLELGGVEVYIDGIRMPILMVSPNRIDVQVPFELVSTNSGSLYVRTLHNNGTVTVTSAVGVIIAPAAPGIYATPVEGQQLSQAVAQHYSSHATGVISIDGTPTPGDVVTMTIENRNYNYVVLGTDTLLTIRDALVALINNDGDERVTATASAQFSRIIFSAKIPGSAGNGLPIAGSAVGQTTKNPTTQLPFTSTPTEVITAFNSSLCCANIAGAAVTQENPAIPGELIIVYATGSGIVEPQSALSSIQDGIAYDGPLLNFPNQSVSSLIGSKTANVLFSGLQVGAIGVYQEVLQLAGTLPTNPLTQLTIAQGIYTSNIVTIPVFAPTQSGVAAGGGTSTGTPPYIP
jgi:uncharacterized protein (TIGR03437 family)